MLKGESAPCPGPRLPSEIVESDVFLGNSELVQHLEDGGIHQGRAAEVVFHVFWRGVVFEVVVVQALVDKSDVPVALGVVKTLLDLPVILRERLRKPDVELKVREFLLDSAEVIYVEQFLPRTAAVPVRYFPVCPFRLEQVEDMCPERGHTGSPADVDHFAVGRVDVEFAVRPGNRHLVARLSRENVGRANARIHVRSEEHTSELQSRENLV